VIALPFPLMRYAGWAVLSFCSALGCASLSSAPEHVAKLETADKVAMVLCAEHFASAYDIPAEDAFLQFCTGADALRPWLDKLSGCVDGMSGAGGDNTGGGPSGASAQGGTGGHAGE
jgi:hypothetical protein